MKQRPSPECCKPVKFTGDVWFDDESALDVEYFMKTLSNIRAKGVRPDLIGSIITHYASKWLPELSSGEDSGEKPPSDSKDSTESATAAWMRKRFCVETIVGVLPPEKESGSCNFLLRLLRVANMVGVEPTYRAELERRVTWQLEGASLGELMIPSFSHTCKTLLDVELVLRLVRGFVSLDEAVTVKGGAALFKVAKLVDCYMAEAAVDLNLNSSQFVALAESLPSHARSGHDGLYRAIDTYLKAHPGASKKERKILCRLLDPCRLSHEASLHAVQNERLPVRLVVQIIFSDQSKIHHPLDWSNSFGANYLDLDQSTRCQSKREPSQHLEIKKLREVVVRLEMQCAAMQRQIEKLMQKKGFSKWKRLGVAALKSISSGGYRDEVEGVISQRTSSLDPKTNTARGRTPKKWRMSVS